MDILDPAGWATIEEVAEGLRLSPITVSRWVKTGYLRGAKVGSLWRIRVEDVEQFVRERMNQKQSEGRTDV
jgi:excisionase family DNA binding protein